jgi:hypothetical protein
VDNIPQFFHLPHASLSSPSASASLSDHTAYYALSAPYISPSRAPDSSPYRISSTVFSRSLHSPCGRSTACQTRLFVWFAGCGSLAFVSMSHRARKERSNAQRPLYFFLFRKVNLWHVTQYFRSRGIQPFNCAQRGQETQGQQPVQPLVLQ